MECGCKALAWQGLDDAVKQLQVNAHCQHPRFALNYHHSVPEITSNPSTPSLTFSWDVDDRPHAEGGHQLVPSGVHHPHHGHMRGADLVRSMRCVIPAPMGGSVSSLGIGPAVHREG